MDILELSVEWFYIQMWKGNRSTPCPERSEFTHYADHIGA